MKWERKISKRFYHKTINGNKYSSLLSLLGISVGCFAMVISLSVLNGFESLVHEKLKGFDGDIRMFSSVKDLTFFENINAIESIMPFMERRGVAETSQNQKIVSLKAVDERLFKSFYDLNFRGSELKHNQIFIGEDLSHRLEKDIGGKITIYSPLDQSIGLGIPYKKEFIIAGIFKTKVLDYDDRFIFMTLDDGKNLFRRKDAIDGFDLRVDTESSIKAVKEDLKALFDNKIEIFTWKDLNRSLVDAMKIERIATMIILSLIFLVSTFHLASSLTLISYQKIKELGILRVMGASGNSIINIIVNIGIRKAGKGMIYGTGIGLLVVIMQNKISFIKIPTDIYFVQSLPMEISFSEISSIVIVSFSFIFLASFIIGRKISKINTMEALNWKK
ncbi:MAG: ABC transporter permease [Candidatus Marinimicrobia bacterium]|nr:ABC transporter permease [Candidatus Neomarinimicrobiota bacterium]